MSSTRCSALLEWYHAHARDLPWRRTTEPYRIWVSEIMLQQTQVKTVLPRYRAWLERFPDIASLADARIDEVLKAWEGLGYYRRARLLHTAAQRIVQQHAGEFPEKFDLILELPGIGRSTAGAIAAFCFAANTPVLDGNVKRVLRRWSGEHEATDRRLWQLAHEQIDLSGEPATWNQAMMELGATHCSPRTPDCSGCPIKNHCASTGCIPEAKVAKRITVRDLHWQVHLHRCPERGLWLRKRPASGIWAGLWAPPITELRQAPDAEPSHIHQLTHRRLHLYGVPETDSPDGDGAWFADLADIALPTGIHRLLAKQEVHP